jgi:mannose-6-phosphate isomerase-like protein (cupin superfamily)
MANVRRGIRRVVTGQSPGQRARVVSDGPVPNVHQFGEDGPVIFEIWKTFNTPERLGHGSEEPAAGPMLIVPPARGHVFRISDIPPDPPGGSTAADALELFSAMGAPEAATHEEGGEPKGGLMHRTQSIDYGIVLDGEITLVVDDDEVHLKVGDVVIQRGSNHAWSNRSGKPCRMAFFMVDALYPEKGK